MTNSDIIRKVLECTYVVYFQEHELFNLNELCAKNNYDRVTFWNIVNRMTDDGSIELRALGGYCSITPIGILHAEEIEVAPPALKKSNSTIRARLLDELAKVYEKQGSYYGIHYEELSNTIGANSTLSLHNLLVLDGLDYVQRQDNGIYKITNQGLDVVESWRRQALFSDEFDKISQMQPQQRGRALQKLLAHVIEEDGWSQEEGVRTSHEEIDIINPSCDLKKLRVAN